MTGNYLSDADLVNLIIGIDEHLLSLDKDPEERSWRVPSLLMAKLGYKDFILAGPGTPSILERIRKLHKRLYHPRDFNNRFLHVGVFMFRDTAVSFEIPLVMGKVGLDPVSHLNMEPLQREWFVSRKTDVEAFVLQYADVFDFMTGIFSSSEANPFHGRASELVWAARFHLQAVSSVLTTPVDHSGAVQSCVLASELVLKAGLAAKGKTDAELKKYSHNLSLATADLIELLPSINAERVNTAVRLMPSLVQNRYTIDQPSRRETGTIAMAAQTIAGEVVRAFTGRTMLEERVR